MLCGVYQRIPNNNLPSFLIPKPSVPKRRIQGYCTKNAIDTRQKKTLRSCFPDDVNVAETMDLTYFTFNIKETGLTLTLRGEFPVLASIKDGYQQNRSQDIQTSSQNLNLGFHKCYSWLVIMAQFSNRSILFHFRVFFNPYLQLYSQVYVYLSVCKCHCLSHLACGDARSARESERAGAVQLPVQVQSSGLCGSVHTLGLLQRWRWWTPCSKSSLTKRGRRREACGGFRTLSLFQFQRGECCCKACCCTNRYHTPAESRSRLIKSFANLQIFSVQII